MSSTIPDTFDRQYASSRSPEQQSPEQQGREFLHSAGSDQAPGESLRVDPRIVATAVESGVWQHEKDFNDCI